MASKFGGPRNKVRVLAGVLRLGPRLNAEVLVQFNLPVEIDPASHSATYGAAAADAATDAPVGMFQDVLSSIRVADWNLFVPAGADGGEKSDAGVTTEARDDPAAGSATSASAAMDGEADGEKGGDGTTT